MTSHLNYLMVEAQQAEVAERAERARRARPPDGARIVRRQPSRLRTGTARLLVALAVRLDGRPTPTAARVSPSGARI
jgi:hypothetical protein